MRSTPIGIADVIKAADALDPRGAALEAMVAMLGFAMPSDAPIGPRLEPEPRPEPTSDDDVGDLGGLTSASEALPPSARRLEPVRQGTAPGTARTDPLTKTRAARDNQTAREQLRRATCLVEYAGSRFTGFLVSGNRIVTCRHALASAGLPEAFKVTFPDHGPTTAGLISTAEGIDAALLQWRDPIAGIAPLTFGRGVAGPWEGYGYPNAFARLGVFVSGAVVDASGRDPLGARALTLWSEQIAGTEEGRRGLSGMPVLQGGRVIGLVSGVAEPARPADAGAVLATAAEDIRASLLPDETLHEPIRERIAPQAPPFEGLFAARDAIALLRLAASVPTPTDRIDVPRVMDLLARAQPILTLPRLRVPSLAFGAQVLVDVGQPMQSFWEDQQELVERFRRALRNLADVRYVGDDPQAKAGPDRRKASWTTYELPRPGTPVIALTDLGCGFPPRGDAARAWLELAARLRRRQCRLVAFAPVRLPRVTMALRRAVHLVVWDRAARRQNLSRLTRVSDE